MSTENEISPQEIAINDLHNITCGLSILDLNDKITDVHILRTVLCIGEVIGELGLDPKSTTLQELDDAIRSYFPDGTLKPPSDINPDIACRMWDFFKSSSTT